MSYQRNIRTAASSPSRYILLIPVLLAILAGTFAQAGDDPATRRREFYDNLKIMGDVYDKIINNYVDEMDPKDVMEAAIKGMLDELDEHSNYLPPVNYEDLVMSTEGEFGGLGITINIRDHYPTVVSDRKSVVEGKRGGGGGGGGLGGGGGGGCRREGR